MASVHQFEYGWTTPVLACILSFVGSLLGLTATARARTASRTAVRARWLALAAFAIGGTGIWTMHFLAMIGFGVDGTAIRFDVVTTVASWLTAVIVVGIGLFLVGFGRRSVWKVLPAGLLTGLGIAAMHYSGMAAMRVNGTVGYDRRYVVAATAIAVVAATVALCFTLYAYRPVALVAGSAVMAVAVCGMHYTGMYGVHVHLSESRTPVTGAEAITFLVPILVLVLAMVVALFYSLLAVPRQSDKEVLAELRARIDGSHPDTRPVSYAEAVGRGFTATEEEWEHRRGPVLTGPTPFRQSGASGLAAPAWQPAQNGQPAQTSQPAPGWQPTQPAQPGPRRQAYVRHPNNR
jgi:NO-binding membrane sensor protein with MHYT domain